MTEEQKYYLDIYKKEANKAYELMHDYRFDYDTYKPISDVSYKIKEQAQKVLKHLYPTYINYPIFLNSLKNIYDNAKRESDEDQEILQIKLNTLNEYKKKYDIWISKINALELEINKDELSQKINEIANLPENLIKSDELFLIQKEIELQSQKIAQEKKEVEDKLKAAQKNYEISIKNNINETNIIKDLITGKEVCLDTFGNEIDMSICKPSSDSGGNANSGYGERVKTASEIINENIENWLKGIDTAYKNQNKTVTSVKEATSSTESTISTESNNLPESTVPTEDITINQDIIPIEAENISKDVEIIDEKIDESELEKDITPEDYINSFVFNVDLSKLEFYKKDEEVIQNQTEQITKNEEKAIQEINTTIPISTDNSNNMPIYDTDNLIKANTDNIYNTKIIIASALIAAFVGYIIIKNKD